MLAVRSLVRGLPRTTSLRLNVLRSIPSRPILRSAFVIKQPACKAFSTSPSRRDPAGESDQALSAKFAHERQLEVEETDPTALPENLKTFFDNSGFSIVDQEGTQLVTLNKKFGNETISIEFNISDMNQINEDFDSLDEDGALEDEDFTPGSPKTAKLSGGKGGSTDDAPGASDDGSVDEEQFDNTSYPLGLNITITKPGAGATYIRATVEDGAIEIESMNYYKNKELIEPQTPDQVRDAQAAYEGPPFENLDQELQEMLYRYLEERGIDTTMAVVLPEYVDFKEQREYVQWLQSMKTFIDA